MTTLSKSSRLSSYLLRLCVRVSPAEEKSDSWKMELEGNTRVIRFKAKSLGNFSCFSCWLQYANGSYVFSSPSKAKSSASNATGVSFANALYSSPLSSFLSTENITFVNPTARSRSCAFAEAWAVTLAPQSLSATILIFAAVELATEIS